jgi:hypothetical protein
MMESFTFLGKDNPSRCSTSTEQFEEVDDEIVSPRYGVNGLQKVSVTWMRFKQ